MSSSGSIISRNHNDTADLWEIAIDSTQTHSALTTEPDVDSVVKQRSGIFEINEDNKEWTSLNVYSGATVRVTDGNDLFLTAFDLDGSWVRTAGYGGDIHVGDFSPFDSGDVIDDVDFIDSEFIDITDYLEMDL